MAEYTVKSGDWLSKIAAANGVTVAQLKEWNPNLFDSAHRGGDFIQPGETVIINPTPAEEAPAETAPTETAPAEPTTVDQGGGVTSSSEAAAETAAAENQVQEGIGGVTPETVSILTSANQNWYFDRNTGLWYASYKLPNSEKRVVFEATGSQMDAIFGEGQRPTNYQQASFDGIVRAEKTVFAGDIMEMSGTGSFESEVNRVTNLAMDEGRLPQWAMDDDAVMDLVYIAHTEDKSDDWLINQLSGLDSFKQRFPGLESYTSLGLTVEESVGAFLELESGVKQELVRQGRNPDNVDPALIGDLIKQGHSLTDVKFVFESYERFNANAGALAAFNEVLAERGLAPLGPEDQLAFLEGSAPADLYNIWEEASFNQAAIDAGLDIGVQDAISLAKATTGQTTYDEAYANLNKAASSILRYRGDLDASRYGLDQEDLIDLSLGIAPRSGRSAAEISQGMERALSAARAGIDGPRANRFRQFTGEGVPQAVSTERSRAKE